MSKSPLTMSALEALSAETTSLAGRAGEQVVWLNSRAGYPTSATLWENGYVVTADHVVDREAGIVVTFADGEEKEAKVAGRDSTSDLALLAVDTGARKVADRVDASELKPGQLALALSRNSEKSLNASLAVVNAIGGEWQTPGGATIDHFIRVDVRTHAGFSGGPLVDAQGRLIGINSARLSRQSPVAVPAATVGRIAKELKERGHIRRGYLGIASFPVGIPESLGRKIAGAPESGLLIMQTEPGSAAEAGGLLIGDILIAVKGTPTREPEELQAALGPETVGTRVTAKVIRGGSELDLQLEVGERPQPQHGAGRASYRGRRRRSRHGE